MDAVHFPHLLFGRFSFGSDLGGAGAAGWVFDEVVGGEMFSVGACGADLECEVTARVDEIGCAETVAEASVGTECRMIGREYDEFHRVVADENAGKIGIVADWPSLPVFQKTQILPQHAVKDDDIFCCGGVGCVELCGK